MFMAYPWLPMVTHGGTEVYTQNVSVIYEPHTITMCQCVATSMKYMIMAYNYGHVLPIHVLKMCNSIKMQSLEWP